MSDYSFRPQAPAKRNWELNPNPLMGLEASVRNNQQQLAMEYASVLIHNLLVEVEELKAEVARLKDSDVPKAEVKRAPVGSTPKV